MLVLVGLGVLPGAALPAVWLRKDPFLLFLLEAMLGGGGSPHFRGQLCFAMRR